jgi:hypothetical protein
MPVLQCLHDGGVSLTSAVSEQNWHRSFQVPSRANAGRECPNGRSQSIEFALHFADPFQMPAQLLVDVVEVRHDSLQHVILVKRSPKASQPFRTWLPDISAPSFCPGSPACALRATWTGRTCPTLSDGAISLNHENEAIRVLIAVRVPNCTAVVRVAT